MKTLLWTVGIDEVGRGPIAGPVTVCAIAMKTTDYQKTQFVGLTDSKLMTKKAREKWFLRASVLQEKGKLKIALASRTAKQIDAKGISLCIKECIAEILEAVATDPKKCAVRLDGSLKAPKEYIHQETIIQGDRKEKIISLASVVAKVSRDAYMDVMHTKHPHFGWNTNKGYGTKAHYTHILQGFLTPLHRKSYLHTVLDK